MKKCIINSLIFLVFAAKGTPAMAQYFGIGALNPQTTLDIAGNGPSHMIRLTDTLLGNEVRLTATSIFAGLPYLGTANPVGLTIGTQNQARLSISPTGNVGINTTSPNSSAILDIQSNNRGLLIPRMTTAQRLAIATPAAGLMVFDTNASAFYFFNGTVWETIGMDSELEKITENGRTGHRILGRNPINYGDIGINAVDLSLSTGVSVIFGATGNASFASGQSTTAAGIASTAMGRNTSALGTSSTAMGENSIASGLYAVAMGNQVVATGNNSVAMGIGDTAIGTASVATGYFSKAGGEYSTSLGYVSEASGNAATAMGKNTTASGASSTAMGINTLASGSYSTAIGNNTIASGYGSTATGSLTNAQSFAEFATGQFNDTLAVTARTIFKADTNRVFTVGIGTSATSRKTAFVVQQNGNVGIGVRKPAALLHVNGEVNINANYSLELGADIAGKELNAGTISYQKFTANALDIIGAGTTAANRRIKLWAEGGVELTGTIVQENVQVPVFQNGWANFGSGFTTAGYWKDKEGIVHLRGLIAGGTTAGGTILFNLPVGYRPSSGRMMFAVLNNYNTGRIDINTNGDVFVDLLSSNAWVNLTGIYFRPD